MIYTRTRPPALREFGEHRMIVFGSRELPENGYDWVKAMINMGIEKWNPRIVIHGKAKGADTMGETYAMSRGLDTWEFPPEYDRYPPKSAPNMRNLEMREHGTCAVGIWSGVFEPGKKTSGTTNMRDSLLAYKIPLYFVNLAEPEPKGRLLLPR